MAKYVVVVLCALFFGRIEAFSRDQAAGAIIPGTAEHFHWTDSFVNGAPIISPQYVEALNAKAKTWTAGLNEPFDKMTVEQAKSIVGCSNVVQKTIPASALNENDEEAANKIPKFFDGRNEWKGCIHPIRNQMHCGSCWAFGATESLSDRLCIATNGKVNVVLSPEELVSCDKDNMGCHGGYLKNAWDFMATTGAVTDSCMPYTSQEGVVSKCQRMCKDGSEPKRYYVVKGTVEQLSGEIKMKQAIMKHGPIEASFFVYRDLYAYKAGIYRHHDGDMVGGHAIKIVGWGEEKGVKYWICANSWGATWGEDGFFRIVRGENEGFIEMNGEHGLADLDRLP